MEQFSRRSFLQFLAAILLVLALGMPVQNVQAAPVTVLSSLSPGTTSGIRIGGLMAAGFKTHPTDSYNATSATLNIISFRGSDTLNVGLYSDDGGHPGTLLASFTPITIPQIDNFDAEYTVTLPAPYALELDTTYWIVWVGKPPHTWGTTSSAPTGIFTSAGFTYLGSDVWVTSPNQFKWALNAELSLPAVSLSTTSIDFGDLQVFGWSAPQTVTLTNTGTGDLHIGTITNDGDFWVTPWNDNCSNQTVIPTGTCTFDVIFTPSSTGVKTGTVSIPSDAATTPDTVALTGNGVASEIQVSPSPLAFGSHLVGSSTTLTATIANIGGADLHIGVLTITGAAYSLVNNLCDNVTLIPNGTCTFGVTFSPPAAGPFAGEVSIPSDSGGLVETDQAKGPAYFPVTTILPLTGTGGQPDLTLSVASLNFGNQVVGTTSAARTVTLTSSGSVPLHLGVLGITGDFALSANTCDNQVIPVGGTCSFSVTFTPTVLGARTGTVSIPSDAASTPDTVTLTGNGITNQTTTLSIPSNGGYDGTIRETMKDARVGGFNEPISALISVGDDYFNRQYVGILDFNTASIPDNAVITSVRVRVKGMILASSTYARLGEMTADIMNPHFGTRAGLENMDFQAPALFKNVGIFTHAPTYYKWITMNVKPTAFSAVNLTGTTQFRLRFQKKYYDDHIKQMLRFLSGDFWIPSDFPMLIITYYVP